MRSRSFKPSRVKMEIFICVAKQKKNGEIFANGWHALVRARTFIRYVFLHQNV